MNDQFLLGIAGTLVGVLVGGLVTTLSSLWLEGLRRRNERKEKLASLKRDALAAALEWIEPMRDAYNRASILLNLARDGDATHEQLYAEWPHFSGRLSTRDLPAHLRAVLPEGTYRRGHRIVRDFDVFFQGGARIAREAQAGRIDQAMVAYREVNTGLDAIYQQVTELETDLRRAYGETFE